MKTLKDSNTSTIHNMCTSVFVSPSIIQYSWSNQFRKENLKGGINISPLPLMNYNMYAYLHIHMYIAE